MGITCSKEEDVTRARQRRHLWDLNSGWHCSIVGTCLTMSDLRLIGKKLGLQTNASYNIDYQHHGFFAHAVEKKSKPSIMLNKLLDKRHGGAVRKIRFLKTEDELEEFWNESKRTGDIPGPYWAVLSHPDATEKLCEKMFADVHMLSHLVGASNRAAIQRLSIMEEEKIIAQEKNLKRQRAFIQRIYKKNNEIRELREKLSNGQNNIGQTNSKALETSALGLGSDSILKNRITNLEEKNKHLLVNLDEQKNESKSHIRDLKTLRQENALLENTMSAGLTLDEEPPSFDLKGQYCLYVGGRPKALPHFNKLLEKFNGHLLYHDGGIEKSIDELASAIMKADTVFFPTDCVSHEAMFRIKQLCRRAMKPFVPLRTSGIASLLNGIKKHQKGQNLEGAAAE